jgi:hypothetical protein
MSRPVLIFPGGMPQSLDFLHHCLRVGRPVIGASSLGHDPARPRYPVWEFLPFITDPGFDAALGEVLVKHDVSGVFTPNPVVWIHLSKALPVIAPGVELVNASPVDDALASYRTAVEKARRFLAEAHDFSAPGVCAPRFAETELAGLIRCADGIPGMCDEFKLRALVEIAASAVEGDVVEIGTWWGKSAYILSHLARHAGIGPLLCVDPWADEWLKQGEKLVDHGSAQVDAEEAFEVFRIGLTPFARGDINYLRMPSTEAARVYRRDLVLDTPGFGSTRYSGAVSILHIDGNHAYNAAKADVEAWANLVVPGGWVVIDDYIWPYGDGPRRVGDEFLAAERGRIDTAFVTGSALFIRLANEGKGVLVPNER